MKKVKRELSIFDLQKDARRREMMRHKQNGTSSYYPERKEDDLDMVDNLIETGWAYND